MKITLTNLGFELREIVVDTKKADTRLKWYQERGWEFIGRATSGSGDEQVTWLRLRRRIMPDIVIEDSEG